MRHAVLLGRGKYADELSGFSAEEGPRPEFLAIALATGAQIFSFTSAEIQRGKWFKRLFNNKPHLGSALNFALSSKSFDRCYVTGEDIGIFAAIFLRLSFWKGKLYCIVHNVTPKKARLLRFVGHHVFGGMIIVSERQRAPLIQYCGIPDEKIYFRHNWVDDQFFTPTDENYRKDNDEALIVACGAENRDYVTLSSAAGDLSMQFEVYGHGFFGIDQKNDSPTEPPNFHRMTRVSFPDLVRAYQRSTAVAIPLNNVDYAAGVTGLVEAMACGKPVIVTETPGLEGYLDAIEPALLLRPSCPTYAVEVFERFVLRSKTENIAAGARNREWVLQHCALDDYAAFVRHLMERAIA